MKHDCITELDAQYRVKVTYSYNGKRLSITKCFNFKKCGGKAEALRQAKEFRDLTKFKISNRTVDDRKKTLKDVIELLDHQTVRSAETKKKANGLINNFILTVISENILFTNIDSVMVQKSLNKAKNKSQDVINRLFGIWCKLYKIAIRNKIVFNDVTNEVNVPRSKIVIKKREQYFDFNQFQRVLDDLSKDDDGKLICTALKLMSYTGCRPSEVLAIERSAIDFDNCSISIHQALGSNETEHNVVIPTKTEESVRTVYFPQDFADELKALCCNRFIFTRSYNRRMTTTYLDYYIKRHSTIEFRPYMLRHCLANRMLDQNVPVYVLQKALGHTSPVMSQRYSRTHQAQVEEAMKKIW